MTIPNLSARRLSTSGSTPYITISESILLVFHTLINLLTEGEVAFLPDPKRSARICCFVFSSNGTLKRLARSIFFSISSFFDAAAAVALGKGFGLGLVVVALGFLAKVIGVYLKLLPGFTTSLAGSSLTSCSVAAVVVDCSVAGSSFDVVSTFDVGAAAVTLSSALLGSSLGFSATSGLSFNDFRSGSSELDVIFHQCHSYYAINCVKMLTLDQALIPRIPQDQRDRQVTPKPYFHHA